MKKLVVIMLAFSICSFVHAQEVAKDYFKDIFKRDTVGYLQDSLLTYPLIGKVKSHIIYSSMIQSTEIEVWVYDAKGRLVYNNVHGMFNSAGTFEAEYIRLMLLNGHQLLKGRGNIQPTSALANY